MPTNTPSSFHEILAQLRAGNDRAANTFVQRYEPMLRRVLRVTRVIPWLQSQLDSQDLVQSVFLRVIADIRADRAEFSAETRLEAYLRTVGRSQLRDQIRRLRAAKRDRQRTVAGNTEALGQVAAAGPTPGELVALREQIALIEECTAPADLEVLWERANGTDWEELAAQRNTTPEAERKRIARVRQRIRQNLGLEG